MKHERPETHFKKGIILAVSAAFFNAVMIFLVKMASLDLPTTFMVFARLLVNFIIILPLIFLNPKYPKPHHFLKTSRGFLYFFRASMGYACLLCYFYSAKYLSLADSTVLFFTAPLIIPIVTFFWGGIKIIHRLWIGIGLGFLGVIVLLHPDRELFHPAMFIGLLAGITSALSLVANRYLCYSEPPLRSLFYYFSICTLLAFIFCLPHWHQFSWSDINLKILVLLIFIGIFGYLYQHCYTLASYNAPLRLTSSFLYSGVIFSLIFDYFFWHIKPHKNSLLGIFFIILGACTLVILYPKEDLQIRKNK
jgi:drug/metabolite transporter (DMT)-like permease